MRILVLGASGMLGNAMLRVMAATDEHVVSGTVRSAVVLPHFEPVLAERIVTGVDVENFDSLTALFAEIRPEVVINCIGLVKQLSAANDPLLALPINSLLPHRLARLAAIAGARLIHVSTDCVFSGLKGSYRETDPSDADDLYGKSKFLGEVAYSHAITLRTSIVGHELMSANGLVEWFLSQQKTVAGYRRAVFSGLPTVEFSRIVRDLVIPRTEMFGLYHVASAPISKHDLLCLLAQTYGRKIRIKPDDRVVVNRSLNADRFREATGYVAPPWPDLVVQMRNFN